MDFSIGNIAKRIDFKISDVPNHVPNHVNFWWGRGLWPWPSRDSKWYFVSFFHPFRFENNWFLKTSKFHKIISLGRFINFFRRFISFKNKVLLIWGYSQLILKCLFGVFKIFYEAYGNKSIWWILVVKSNFFICFLEELRVPKSPFEIN